MNNVISRPLLLFVAMLLLLVACGDSAEPPADDGPENSGESAVEVTASPEPTATPEATATPAPTSSPEPTSTPEPTTLPE